MNKIFRLLLLCFCGFTVGFFACCFLSTSDYKAVDVTFDLFPYAQKAKNCDANLKSDTYWLTNVKKNADTIIFSFQSPINIRYYGLMGVDLFSGIMTLTESSFDVAVVETEGVIECVK